MAEHWFRSHHGAPTDPKWSLIGRKVKCAPGIVAALWWALMDHASQSTPRGSVAGFDLEVLGHFYGFDVRVLERIMGQLRERRMVDDDMIAAWGVRQPKREDDSTERVRKHREVKRDVTHGNARGEERRREENTTTTTPRADKLAGYMGAILSEAADRVDAIPGQPRTWRDSVYALYGPNGTTVQIWGSVPENMRPSMLAEAMDALAGEEKRYQAAFFKAILERIIRGTNGGKRTDTRTDARRDGAERTTASPATVTPINDRRRRGFDGKPQPEGGLRAL